MEFDVIFSAFGDLFKKKKSIIYLLIFFSSLIVLFWNFKDNLISSICVAISVSSFFLFISELWTIIESFKNFSKLEGEYQSFRYIRNKNNSQTDNIELNKNAFFTKVKYRGDNLLSIEHNYLNKDGKREKWVGEIVMQSKFHGLLPWEKVISNGEPLPINKKVVGVKQVYTFYRKNKIWIYVMETQKPTSSIGKELFKRLYKNKESF